MMPLERQSFDNFITGRDNKIASLAAKEVARYPGRRYNPLFIFGGPGTGKTHLLYAIAGEMDRRDPSLLVSMVNYHAITGCPGGVDGEDRRGMIRETWISSDALLVDDLCADGQWMDFQLEMLEVVDELIRGEKQVVFASSIPPGELVPSVERFISRIRSGLTVRIGASDQEIKERMALRLVEGAGVKAVGSDLIPLIDLPVEDIREFMGIVKMVLLYLEADGSRLTRTWLVQTLRRMVRMREIRKFIISPAEEASHEGVKGREGRVVNVDEGMPAGVPVGEHPAGEVGGSSEAPEGMQTRPAIKDMEVEEGTSPEVAQATDIQARDESEGFIMEWDREEDRMLNEL
jgi:chromosomal replication initiator protein